MAGYLSSDSNLDALEDFSHAIFCNAELIAFVHYLFWDNINLHTKWNPLTNSWLILSLRNSKDVYLSCENQ